MAHPRGGGGGGGDTCERSAAPRGQPPAGRSMATTHCDLTRCARRRRRIFSPTRGEAKTQQKDGHERRPGDAQTRLVRQQTMAVKAAPRRRYVCSAAVLCEHPLEALAQTVTGVRVDGSGRKADCGRRRQQKCIPPSAGLMSTSSSPSVWSIDSARGGRRRAPLQWGSQRDPTGSRVFPVEKKCDPRAAPAAPRARFVERAHRERSHLTDRGGSLQSGTSQRTYERTDLSAPQSRMGISGLT